MIRKLQDKNVYDIRVFLLGKIQSLFYKNRYGQFGRNSFIEKPLIIRNRKNIFIGNFVAIRKNIRIEMVKKYGSLEYSPKLTISDHSVIEFNCHITCASQIYIGKNVMIAGYVTIVDNNHGYEEIDLPIKDNNLTFPSGITIDDGSFVGMGARIMPGVHIGKHCVIGANSVVTKNIPDYSVAVGLPAKIIKRYNFKTNQWERTNEQGGFLDE